MPHTRIWDESLPPGSQAAAQGATRIRDMKVDITERMAIDHYWDVDVNTDGWHKKVTLPETTDPAAVANQGMLYTKDDAGVTHLYFRDSAGVIAQLTGQLSNIEVSWNDLVDVPAEITFLEGLTDPGVDSFIMWDDSLGDFAFVPAGTTFAGFVGSDGSTGNNLPAGWSAVRNSLGKYTITHSLGNADYAIIAMWDNQATPARVQVGSSSKGANSVDIHFYNQTDGPAFVDTDFQFILKLYG